MNKRLSLVLSVLILAGAGAFAQKYTAVADKSILRWTGKKIGKSHEGVIKLKEGSFVLNKNKFVSGEFIVDMNSMVEGDGSDPTKGSRLMGHLKSDDFFSSEKFPVATLTIKSSTAFVKDEAEVTADLTIKGVTHPVTFPVKKTGDMFQATVTFDRSKYDVRYGSKSFFDNLGDGAIDDMIPIVVTLVTTKQ